MEKEYLWGDSSLEIIEGIYYMQLREKSYYENGLAYGNLLIKSGYPFIGILRSSLGKIVLKMLYWLTKRNIKNINVPSDYLEEIRGYADSLGVPFEQLHLLNVIFDVLPKYGIHCSTFMFFNEQSTITGRNTDLVPNIASIALKYMRPLVIQCASPGKYPFVHVAIPLLLGVIKGVNSQGMVAASHQVVRCIEELPPHRLATPLLTRILLESSGSMEDARNLINENKIIRCLNVLVGSAKQKDAQVFEITPKKFAALAMEGRFNCCTTHFRTPEFKVFHDGDVDCSEKRLGSMYKMLGGKTVLHLEEAFDILRDQSNGAKYDHGGYSMTNPGTYHSFVFDLTRNKLYVNNGTSKPITTKGKYVEINYNLG